MSMQRECVQFKTVDGKWYMHLADDEHGELDNCSTYGPFDSREAVDEFLHAHFPNPGGLRTPSDEMPVPTESPNGSPVIDPKKWRW